MGFATGDLPDPVGKPSGSYKGLFLEDRRCIDGLFLCETGNIDFPILISIIIAMFFTWGGHHASKAKRQH